MSSELVVRIARSDRRDDYVLVKVMPQRSSPLDLRLIATEGEAPYVGSVTKDNLGKIRAKNYAGDDEEWHSIIAWIFLRKRVDGRLAGALRGLETVATIEGNLLTITLRKTISGITQRLGTIGLHQDEAQAIELFEWAGIAAAATTALETEVATLSAKYQDQQKALIKLSSQLKDLTKTKEEHENVLLEKFMELLNAKKLKIRDQQRLLAGAKVDPDKADRVQDARSSRAPREVAPSRTSKRKARAKPVAASSASDGDDFETMDISMEKNAGVQLDNEEQVSTPDKSDLDATEDEDEAVDTVANAPMTQSGIGSKGKVMDVAKKEDEASSKSKRASPPPRRELPFSQAGTAKGPRTEDLPHTSRAKPEGNTDDEETEGETDDDEL